MRIFSQIRNLLIITLPQRFASAEIGRKIPFFIWKIISRQAMPLAFVEGLICLYRSN